MENYNDVNHLIEALDGVIVDIRAGSEDASVLMS